MKPYDELRSLKPGSIDSFLALTYSIDLAWFERTLLPALRVAGARHIAIFADANELSKCLVAKYQFIAAAGVEYLVVPMRGANAFHPKAYVASGPKQTRIFVGSGNLTSTGFGRNLEVFSRFETGQARTAAIQADLRRYVYGQLGRYRLDAAPLRPYLDAALGRDAQAQPAELLLDGPACWRVFSALQAEELTVLSPYFDEGAQAVPQLAKACGAKRVRVITGLRSTTLTRGGAIALQGQGVELDVLDPEPRPLHAKVVLVRTTSGELIAMAGSLNASHAAWHGANAELGLILRGASAEHISRLLSDLPRRRMADEDIAELRESVEPKSAQGAVSLHAAERESQRSIRVQGIEAGTVKVLGVGVDLTTAVEMAGPGEGRVSLPPHIRTGISLIVRTVESHGAGAAVPVMDRFALQEAAQQRSGLEQAFRNALHGNFDGTDTEKLFALFADVWRRRVATDGDEAGAASERGDRPNDGVVVVPALRDDQRPVTPAGPRISLRMIDLLLFGAGSDDAPEESEGNPDEPPESDRDMRQPRDIDPPDAAQLIAHLRAAERDYRAFLAETEDDETRLASTFLDDLLVLSGLLHYALNNGLTHREYRFRLGRLLRDLIGSSSAHLVRALTQVPEQDRDVWHERVPILPMLLLNLYNLELCLSGPGRGPYLTTLWLRHLVPVVPSSSMDHAVERLSSELTRLKKGPLWAAPRLMGDRTEALDPLDYASAVIADARAYLALDRWLAEHGWPAAPTLAVDEGDHATIVQPIGRGNLAVGFAERDERTHPRAKLPLIVVWLRTDPMAVPDDIEVPMTRGSAPHAILTNTMVSWLREGGGPELAETLERLSRLEG